MEREEGGRPCMGAMEMPAGKHLDARGGAFCVTDFGEMSGRVDRIGS
jgi:hypothetical protein